MDELHRRAAENGMRRLVLLAVPGRRTLQCPALRGRADYVGFSYYFTVGLRGGQMEMYPEGAPTSPLGYAIHPEGVGLVLDELRTLAPELPIIVAENGIGTDDDQRRADYLRAALTSVNEAIWPRCRRARINPLDGGRQLRVETWL
jgi:hypothetical protein